MREGSTKGSTEEGCLGLLAKCLVGSSVGRSFRFFRPLPRTKWAFMMRERRQRLLISSEATTLSRLVSRTPTRASAHEEFVRALQKPTGKFSWENGKLLMPRSADSDARKRDSFVWRVCVCTRLVIAAALRRRTWESGLSKRSHLENRRLLRRCGTLEGRDGVSGIVFFKSAIMEPSLSCPFYPRFFFWGLGKLEWEREGVDESLAKKEDDGGVGTC